MKSNNELPPKTYSELIDKSQEIVRFIFKFVYSKIWNKSTASLTKPVFNNNVQTKSLTTES